MIFQSLCEENGNVEVPSGRETNGMPVITDDHAPLRRLQEVEVSSTAQPVHSLTLG